MGINFLCELEYLGLLGDPPPLDISPTNVTSWKEVETK